MNRYKIALIMGFIIFLLSLPVKIAFAVQWPVDPHDKISGVYGDYRGQTTWGRVSIKSARQSIEITV